jgi:hypothetical protein
MASHLGIAHTRIGVSRTHTAGPAGAPPSWLWPSLRSAASIIGVNASTLSRRDLPTTQAGSEQRVAPVTVMELGDHYRRRPIGEVAAELVDVARAGARTPDEVEQVEHDLADYLDRTRAEARANALAEITGDAWLSEAQRRLSPELFDQVRAAIDGGADVGSVRGVRFDYHEEG